MRRFEAVVHSALCALPLCALCACQSVLQLDEYDVARETADGSMAPAPECVRNSDCAQLEGGTLPSPGSVDPSAKNVVICEKTTQTCVPLLSADCQRVSGDFADDDAIILGTLFSTSGQQGSVNLARERSAVMAAEEINAAGGIPTGATASQLRPLVLVSCDEAQLMRAGNHLVNELHVPAIIGPNTSQDTLDLSNRLTIEAGTLVISPTSVAASVADLLDADLTWQMVPNDMQRVPLMVQAISSLETSLRAARTPQARAGAIPQGAGSAAAPSGTSLKLAVIYRDDALGQGTRFALDSLVFNDKSVADPDNRAQYVRIRPYNPSALDDPSLVTEMAEFAPDIIVLVGTAEAITQVMVPLEDAWRVPQRPEYVLIESSKTPELIDAVTGKPELRRRIRGTGTLPAARSARVHESFAVSYTTRYPAETSDLYGLAPAYDATYAVAYSIAALRGQRIQGPALAQKLRLLSAGGMEVELQRSMTLTAFRFLSEGLPVTVVGANAPLQWDLRGAVVGGTVELWCISDVYEKPSYASSGLTLDLMTGVTQGTYTQCPR